MSLDGDRAGKVGGGRGGEGATLKGPPYFLPLTCWE